MRNRFLGGVSFLPLFAPADKPGGGDQVELALDPAEVAAHGDPDWEANDPNDAGTVAVEGDGDPEPDTGKVADPEPEPVVAAAAGDGEPADPEAETPEQELEQLRKTAKALGKRLGIVSKEKQALSAKLQATIKEVPKDDAEPAAADGDAPVRSDFATKAEFDTAVQAETNRRLAVQEFNGKCNAVEAKGADTFKAGWAKAKASLAMLDDDNRIPMDILSVALETDDPARVLFVLGNDIEKATELMGMTPIKRAIAMDKIASAPKAAPVVVSKTPAPVDPIGGKGAGDDKPSDRDSDEEWNRKEEIRERQRAEQRRKNGY